MKHLQYILLFLFFLSCAGNRKNAGQKLSGNTLPDTIIMNNKTFIILNDDSAYSFSKYSKNRSVIYTYTIPTDSIHYRVFDENNILIEVAFAKELPLAFDSLEYGGEMYNRQDSVVQFYKDGKVFKTGYVEYTFEEDFKYADRQIWEEYWQYDTLGNLNYHIIPTIPGGWTHIGESYHPNGKIKERWEQGDVYTSGALLHKMEWDSLGNVFREHIYEHLFPEWGESYNHRFTIETITEFYPHGKTKQISKYKSFVESGEYPCGCWDYFDMDGRKIKFEQYYPCDNFTIEY